MNFPMSEGGPQGPRENDRAGADSAPARSTAEAAQ
jgi:hypothetical protein